MRQWNLLRRYSGKSLTVHAQRSCRSEAASPLERKAMASPYFLVSGHPLCVISIHYIFLFEKRNHHGRSGKEEIWYDHLIFTHLPSVPAPVPSPSAAPCTVRLGGHFAGETCRACSCLPSSLFRGKYSHSGRRQAGHALMVVSIRLGVPHAGTSQFVG